MACDSSYPSYLNEELLLKSLANLEKCNSVEIKILNFGVKKATSSGDNYLSEVFRVQVKYCKAVETKNISLIVKCIESSENRDKIIESLNAFHRECQIFKILPELAKIVHDKFSAEAYYATEHPVKMLVFEDLQPLGYRLADRVSGLDLKHCEVIFEKIGRFHGASMLYTQQSLKSLQRFTFNFFNPDDKEDTIIKMFCRSFSMLVEVAQNDEEWGILDRKILEKLINLEPKFKEKLTECMNQLSDEWMKVLNHGDLWINNIMFKYSDDCVPIVDFQLSCYSSPGIDLNYCLNTCPISEIRENYADYMVEKYHNALTNTLKKVDYSLKIPDLREIKKEIEKYSFHGLAAAIFILPLVSLDREACDDLNPNANEMMNEENSRKILQRSFKGRYFQDSIIPILNRYYKMGVLD